MPAKPPPRSRQHRRGRRQPSSRVPTPSQARQALRPGSGQAPAAASRIPPPASQRWEVRGGPSPAPEVAPDYSYVGRDLKRIGIIMGGMVVVLIVLSVFW